MDTMHISLPAVGWVGEGGYSTYQSIYLCKNWEGMRRKCSWVVTFHMYTQRPSTYWTQTEQNNAPPQPHYKLSIYLYKALLNFDYLWAYVNQDNGIWNNCLLNHTLCFWDIHRTLEKCSKHCLRSECFQLKTEVLGDPKRVIPSPTTLPEKYLLTVWLLTVTWSNPSTVILGLLRSFWSCKKKCELACEYK